jgi:hypothetical protein
MGQTTYGMREQSTSLPYSMLLELVQVLGYDPATLCPELAERITGDPKNNPTKSQWLC